MLLADRYAELLDSARVHERALSPLLLIPGELELQARWFAGNFGKRFHAVSGEDIEIVQFGTWNRAAGPDFSDAVIRIDSGEPIRGTVEFDLVDRNWETHGHSANSAFEDTILHVFVQRSDRIFFSRTKSNRNVLQLQVDPRDLPDAFPAIIPLARAGRCQAPLNNLPEERLCRILAAAAQFRLQRKAARIRNIIENHGRNEALFQETAAALGYRENKLAFTLLAQRLPLGFLRRLGSDAEAMLFGVAGFLDTPDLGIYSGQTREYLRKLWDRWWPHRDPVQRLVLPAKLWHLNGTRPLNHPQRRLGALAAIISSWPAFTRAITKKNAKSIERFFHELSHPFWNFSHSLASGPITKEKALVGESRVAELMANVLIPFLLAEGIEVWDEYEKFPARLSNRRLETGAARLFGADPRRSKFTKTIAHQQGLLQIYEDFCLRDNSDCAECPFPEQMRKWK